MRTTRLKWLWYGIGTLIPLFSFSTAWSQGAIDSLEASYRFLVSERASQGGALYVATAGALKGRVLPLSFVDSAAYWGAFVCAPTESCAVTDLYDPKDYSLAPAPGPAGEMQTERVNVHNGANIYDAAVWQIAVVLGQTANGFANPYAAKAYDLANHQNLLLQASHCGNATVAETGANRAVTKKERFVYNGLEIGDPENAYVFRMLGRDWLSEDPFKGSPYENLIQVSDLPARNPDYSRGKITWSDWKPITGENAWAFLLGPLQAAYLHHVRYLKGTFVPFEDLAVQQALAVLPTFAAMQSEIGAVYYAPAGTAGNLSGTLAHPHQVSVENNFSVYAGLNLLRAILRTELVGQSNLSGGDKRAIRQALSTIQTMLHGGSLGRKRSTAGLLDFFQNRAWRDGTFVQGGLANAEGQSEAWVPALSPKAVDANTWAVAALGARQIDAWFGRGAAFNLWQQVKSWGAYGVERTLWGMGYSDQDGNGLTGEGTYRQGILSAEWTAGAIVMVRNMRQYYRSAAGGLPEALRYVESLTGDEQAMLAAIGSLRHDRYADVDFPGKPKEYSALIRTKTLPYLYASRRAMIPFGWYANAIPSTCATAWIVLIADDYDPFGYAGRPN
ncbi:MAG: hypothetical protein HZB24_16445 [Desulfobacterales bacterium]|nr:hypothetical protein [Desulfobacterales bacterium]